ncbi:hypothetical protein NKJ23_07350 [Mesorhizobium sp. M0184]|uniref:hypothetical protein n=1 Tax=Mesorhizobium sp. M0184 TaxID=2956906 RepID=UPI003338D004
MGTAIGVMLPHTAAEDEQLGAYRDKLRDSAEDVFEKGLEQAKQVAAEAYETAKEEADRQGTSGDAETLVDRVGEVVKSTASKTEEAIRDRLPESDDSRIGGVSENYAIALSPVFRGDACRGPPRRRNVSPGVRMSEVRQGSATFPAGCDCRGINRSKTEALRPVLKTTTPSRSIRRGWLPGTPLGQRAA